jgi:hypothetical protein
MTARHNPPHDPTRWPTERIVVHSWDEVPAFVDECEEQEFWSTHEMGDEFFENVEPDAATELPPPRQRAPRRHATG